MFIGIKRQAAFPTDDRELRMIKLLISEKLRIIEAHGTTY
jgi:hypothetical protein